MPPVPPHRPPSTRRPSVELSIPSQTLSVDSTGHFDLQALRNPPLLGLVLLWSRDEPDRVGELALLPSPAVGTLAALGRGGPGDGGPLPHLAFRRQRPGHDVATGPFRSPRISRTQIRLELAGPHALAVTNVGRCPLVHEGREVERAVLAPGDLIELRKLALLLCVERPFELPRPDAPLLLHPFGGADAQGLVGESPAAWEMRARIAFAAEHAAHVLVRGPSGTGKELLAQAIHRLSARGRKPLVARNAATFPETLIDAELFGNAKNFPNVGTPERPGLVGEADGSTLFLDEFAELPQAMQAHLLRVLDAGEYTRLGEARPRRSDFRLIAATNRPESALKEDVLARLPLRIEAAGLDRRREDIPLLARHALRRMADQDRRLAQRFFPDGDVSAPPRLGRSLIERLVRHPYTTHVRELAALLWQAVAESPAEVETLDFGPPGALDLTGSRPQPAPQPHFWADAPTGAPPPPDASQPPDAAPPAAARPPAAEAAPRAVEPAQRAAEAAPRRPADPARRADTPPAPAVPPRGPAVDPLTIDPALIQACLDRHGGRQEPAWRELGLSSRHVLTRLVRRYNLTVRGRSPDDSPEGAAD
ncbi:MAG TPA: sigma 54-interacting transcriptional regulator [Polyangiaceae bacterium]|nr:sigma 54-interacting transcriptional regulator [Polyangiaceae bacterium]